jgi:hypothetical protein
VIAPQMPAGGLIRQTVLHDEAHGQRDHTMGVMGLGQRVVRHVGVEVFPATAAMMLRVHQMDVTRSGGNQVSDVVQDAGEDTVSAAALAALRAGPMAEVPAAGNDLRCGQIFRLGDALGRVRQILPGTRHGNALLDQLLPARSLGHLPA